MSDFNVAYRQIAEHVGYMVRDRRNACDWTLKQLAEYSGISVKTINDIELGVGNPQFLTLIKLFTCLNLNLSLEVGA